MPESLNYPKEIRNLFNSGNKYTILSDIGKFSSGNNPMCVDLIICALGRVTIILSSSAGQILTNLGSIVEVSTCIWA